MALFKQSKTGTYFLLNYVPINTTHLNGKKIQADAVILHNNISGSGLLHDKYLC